MKMRCLYWGLSVLLVFFSFEYAQGRYVIIERTAAFVGEKVILKSDLVRYACYMSIKTGTPVEAIDRKEILSNLIDEMVLVKEAEKTGIVEPDRETVDGRIGKIREMAIRSAQGCEFLEEGNEFLEELVRNEIMAERYIEKRIEIFVKITEEDSYNYYLGRRDTFPDEYNEETERLVKEELKGVLVEREVSSFLRRVKKRIKIVVPEE